MVITEVATNAERKKFIEFPSKLYRGDVGWISPLHSEIEAVFDPLSNAAFSHGTATRWILTDDDGETIGRVAAFIDEIRSRANRQPTGGMGFFEVIESREAAFLLFDTARDWLAARGIKAMDGPINFGENDNHWGLLVDGFMPQAYGMPYNKRYYHSFFEEYGFKTYFEQYCYHRDLTTVELFPERFMKIAQWISKRPGYSFKHFSHAERNSFVADMVEIYNATWSVFKEDFTPLDPQRLRNSLKEAAPIIDPDLIWFAYHNDKPVAFFVIFPDLNQILRHFNGRLTLWNKMRFLWYKKHHEMTRIRGFVAGVHPSYQNSGIESAIFLELFHVFKKKPWYRELELSWVGDFNPKMISIYEAVGAQKAKTHLTMRYMIDQTLPFITYREEMTENRSEREAVKK